METLHNVSSPGDDSKNRDYTQSHSREVFLDTLFESRQHQNSSISSILSLLLFGTSDESISNRSQVLEYGQASFRWSLEKRASAVPLPRPDVALYIISLRNAVNDLHELQRFLFLHSMRTVDQTVLCKELTFLIQDIAFLLVISTDPCISYSIVDVTQLLILSVHILATCQADMPKTMTGSILKAITSLCGALFSSHRGISDTSSAFEDRRLERAWFNCLLGEFLAEHKLISELRRGPGVWALAEEIQKCSRDVDISPPLALSKAELGIATATLLDAMRTSQIILQLQLTDMEHIRRHSDIISQTCLDLAKLCIYDCGREALCASVIDTPLPTFLIAVEKHSMSQTICETARYLSIQIFHTSLQYRSLLSPSGEATLRNLFRHIEPSAFSPSLLFPVYNGSFRPHLASILDVIDHPHVLWTNVGCACQLFVVLSNLSGACNYPGACRDLIVTISELRVPYSSTALICAALDEVVNALSRFIHGEEFSPGFLQYPKPPFPLLPTEQVSSGAKILQQSDARIFVFRCAIYLCDILLSLIDFCYGESNEQISSNDTLKEGSIRYIVKSCVRSIHLCRSFAEEQLSLSSKLERSALKILSKLASTAFPPDITLGHSRSNSRVECILEEVVNEGRFSPGICETAADILSFLMTDWRSEDILINNRLTGTFRESLDKLVPEFSELLIMWDGDCEQSRWLLAGGQHATKIVWEEILSRIEFWMSRGHSRYVLKWLVVLRKLLSQSTERQAALADLDKGAAEKFHLMTFEKWLGRISDMMPETDAESIGEIDLISALCQRVADDGDLDALAENLDTEDLIYVNSTDYLEDLGPFECWPSQRPGSPAYWRGRFSPEQGLNYADDSAKSTSSLNSTSLGGPGFRNGGGGKVYVQNEFRSAHGASRNTSRAPSVHVDDFYSNN